MKTAVVIPCYRVRRHILDVIARIPPEVSVIYVVDDACPEQTGNFVKESCKDTRVDVVFNPHNLGVGGAVLAGYRRALDDGADIIVKIDGDGQMPPELLPAFISPIIGGHADYAKGNRFYDLENLRPMPLLRTLGNAVLSLLSKLSTGYWYVIDPNNGYTAVHSEVLRMLPLDKISQDYFFESDMLFRLNLVDAVVCDVPMRAYYGSEVSNLKVGRAIPRFLRGHFKNTLKRMGYCHFLRGFSVASLELLASLPLLLFSLIFGSIHWARSIIDGVPATAGTVMLASLPGLVGLQLLLSFFNHDMNRAQNLPRHLTLGRQVEPRAKDAASSG